MSKETFLIMTSFYLNVNKTKTTINVNEMKDT